MRKSVTHDTKIINDILDRAEVLWLAFVDDEGPCSMPVNFARNENTLYVHSGRKGRKFRALSAGNPIGFSCVVDIVPKTGENACSFSFYFRSVMGTALPTLLPEEQTCQGLDVITTKYTGKTLPYNEKYLPLTATFALEICKSSARIKE